MILANDADAAGTAFVISDEKISLDDAFIAVAQGEHAGAVPKGVRPIDIATGFIRDDFNFAVATFEQVLFDDRAGVAHRLPAVTHTDGLATIAAQGWARSE